MTRDESQVDARIFSVGHSNHSIEWFIELMRRHQIQMLVDTRSFPYSRQVPQFDATALKQALSATNIGYLFLGKELGGRPQGAEFYDAEGHVLYSRLAQSGEFLEGIRRLENGLQKYRIALLCAEEDPSICHRHLLIGRVLVSRGIALEHIRGDGRLQTEAELAAGESRRHQDSGQIPLFGESEEPAWRSIRSVSRKERLPSSSEH